MENKRHPADAVRAFLSGQPAAVTDGQIAAHLNAVELNGRSDYSPLEVGNYLESFEDLMIDVNGVTKEIRFYLAGKGVP